MSEQHPVLPSELATDYVRLEALITNSENPENRRPQIRGIREDGSKQRLGEDAVYEAYGYDQSNYLSNETPGAPETPEALETAETNLANRRRELAEVRAGRESRLFSFKYSKKRLNAAIEAYEEART